jgi:TatA/E family protein of Tat protein translocase
MRLSRSRARPERATLPSPPPDDHDEEHASMPSIGPLEMAIVLAIALIVFGPKRLPDLGRQLGGGLREFKESISGSDRARELTADSGDARVE